MKTSENPNQVTYREVTEADFPAVARLYDKLDNYLRQLEYTLPKVENPGQLYLEAYRRTLGRFSMIYIAEYENQAVGFILARIKQVPAYRGGVMVGELQDIWVEPQVRRLGVARQLTYMEIEWLKSKEVRSVEVQVLVSNEASLNLVKLFGCKPELLQLRLKWEDYTPGNVF
jgi:ribosomal protein S18 acetylase RimI-like enzyme